MALISVLVGVVLLTLGKRLFWLFVGGVGFVAAMALANEFLEPQTDLVILGIALVAGFLGALLALFMQKVAIGVGGFLGGGYLAISALDLLGLELGIPAWQPFVIGGILGALLAYPLFDWALIVLSSLTGALLLAQAMDITRVLALAVFAVAFVFGVAVQAGLYTKWWKRRRGEG